MRNNIFLGVVFALLLGANAAETTSDQALVAAESWAADNSSAVGGLGVPRSAVAVRDSDGTLLWWTVSMSKGGAIVVAPDTEINPVISVIPHYTGTIEASSTLYALLRKDMRMRKGTFSLMRDRASAGDVVDAKVAASSAKSAARWKRLMRKGSIPARRLLATKLAAEEEEEESKSVRDPELPEVVLGLVPGFEYNGVLTHWNQDNTTLASNDQIYNLYTPSNYVCGCVATAISAVQQFFRTGAPAEPATGKCTVDGVNVELATMEGDYDWSILPVEFGGEATDFSGELSDDQVDLLARVAYNSGVTVNMEYSKGESGAYAYDIAPALRDVFGFKDGRYAFRLKEDHYPRLIYNQVRAGAPVLMGITGTPGGHQVVAVGYGEDAEGTPLTRVFLGWSGNNDAWYALPDIDAWVDATGKPTNAKFNVIEDVVTMLGTNTATMALCGRVVKGDGTPVVGAEIEIVPASRAEEVTDEESGETFTTNVCPVATTDDNGYWGLRVEPGAFQISTNKLIYLKIDGERVQRTAVTVGLNAIVTRDAAAEGDTTINGSSHKYLFDPAKLASALPGVVDFHLFGSGKLEVVADPESAQSFALESGKAMLVVSGTAGDPKYDAILAYIDEHADEMADSFVLYLVDPSDEEERLPDGNPAFGVFDPTIFNSQAANKWAFYNGRLAYCAVPAEFKSEEVTGHESITGEEITGEIVYDEDWTEDEVIDAFERVIGQGGNAWSAHTADSTLVVEGETYYYGGETPDVVYGSENGEVVEIGEVAPFYGLYENVYTNGEEVALTAPLYVTNLTDGVIWMNDGWELWQYDEELADWTFVEYDLTQEVVFPVPGGQKFKIVWWWYPSEIYVDVKIRDYKKGGGIVEPGSGWYPYESVVTLNATPDEGSQFLNWNSSSGDSLTAQIPWYENDGAYADAGTVYSFTLYGDRRISIDAEFGGGFREGSAESFSLLVKCDGLDDSLTPPEAKIFGEGVAYDTPLEYPAQKLGVILATNEIEDAEGNIWSCDGWHLEDEEGNPFDPEVSGAGAAAGFSLTTNAVLVWSWSVGSEPVVLDHEIAWNDTFSNLDSSSFATNLLTAAEYNRLLSEGKDEDDLNISVPTGWKAKVAADATTGVTVTLELDEEVLAPKAVAPSTSVMNISPNDDGTLSVSANVSNAAAGFWYTLFAADALGDTWAPVGESEYVSGTAGAQPTADGAVSLSIVVEAEGGSAPSSFYKLVVSEKKPE